MCNAYCILFGAINLKAEEVKGKRIIEIGSYSHNGGLRPLIESYFPSEYIGVDLKPGPSVDIICRAEDVLEKFGKECFDVVISTELLEHVRDWKKVLKNIKSICKAGGIILVTTRSFGCPYHGFPFDFWRYELNDFRHIFSDCGIEKIEKDPGYGVMIKVRKQKEFSMIDLSNYKLYSILHNRRVSNIEKKETKKLSLIANYKQKTKVVLSSLRNLF